MLSLVFSTDKEASQSIVSAAQTGSGCVHILCTGPLILVTYQMLA